MLTRSLKRKCNTQSAPSRDLQSRLDPIDVWRISNWNWVFLRYPELGRVLTALPEWHPRTAQFIEYSVRYYRCCVFLRSASGRRSVSIPLPLASRIFGATTTFRVAVYDRYVNLVDRRGCRNTDVSVTLYSDGFATIYLGVTSSWSLHRLALRWRRKSWHRSTRLLRLVVPLDLVSLLARFTFPLPVFTSV